MTDWVSSSGRFSTPASHFSLLIAWIIIYYSTSVISAALDPLTDTYVGTNLASSTYMLHDILTCTCSKDRFYLKLAEIKFLILQSFWTITTLSHKHISLQDFKIRVKSKLCT